VTRRLAALAGLTIAAGLLAPAAARAQAFGAQGGVTFVKIVHQPGEDYGLSSSADAGLLGGAFVTLLESKPFSIQVDGVVALRKVDFGVSVQELTSFDVPVVARSPVLTSGAWVVRAAGVVTSTMIFKAEETTAGGEPFDVKVAFEPFILSAVVGGQAEWKKRWLFEGRFMFGLTEVDSDPIPGFTSRLRGFEITAGYRFW
jgi:hypothetical protein